MIYRRPSHSRQEFVFRVIGASTGAVLVGAACKFEIAPPPSADETDASEDVQFSSSGSGAGGGFLSGSASGGTGICGNSGSCTGGIVISGSSGSGASSSGGFHPTGSYGSASSSSSGVGRDASPCESGSSGGCTLIHYDAMDDSVENLDTGLHEEAAVTDVGNDGAAETGDP